MSVYTDCGEAARRLLEDPTLGDTYRYTQLAIFTEIDVVALAARTKRDWGADVMRVAQREASQVMGALYRSRDVVRYGPVQVPQAPEADYMRVASKIVYSHPESGPEKIKTPNGTFKRLKDENDPIARQGRRLGTNRNDLEPWSEQQIKTVREAKPATRPRAATAPIPAPTPAVPAEPATEAQTIERLRAELSAANERVSELEAENERLRATRSPIEDAVLDVLNKLGVEDRLTQVEKLVATG